MIEAADFLVGAFLISMGATAVMESGRPPRKWLRGITPPDYGLVGRWLAYRSRDRWGRPHAVPHRSARVRT